MGRSSHRARLSARVLEAWHGATPATGRHLIGTSKRGDAIMLPEHVLKPVTGAVLREMFEEARAAGIAGQLYVYGTLTTVSESGRFHFTQVDPRTCRIFE